jgi:hypothetical protein
MILSCILVAIYEHAGVAISRGAQTIFFYIANTVSDTTRIKCRRKMHAAFLFQKWSDFYNVEINTHIPSYRILHEVALFLEPLSRITQQ